MKVSFNQAELLNQKVAKSAPDIIGSVALIGLVILVTVDVLGRYFFNNPLPSAMEISTLLMPYIVFVAFAYALMDGTHVRVTLVLNRLSPKAVIAAEIIDQLAGVFFFGVLTIWSWKQFWNSFVIREVMCAQIPLPWWVGKLAMPIGMVIITVTFLIMFIRQLKGNLPEER